MKKGKLKKSLYLPILLVIYLASMSYIAYPEYESGNYVYYFGVIGFTSVIIIVLHIMLRRKEQMQREREEDIKNSKKE